MPKHYSNTSGKNNKIEVQSDDTTKTIGTIRDNVFSKSNFQCTKHICHKHRAIGLDKWAFMEVIRPYSHLIKCEDKQKGLSYCITTQDFETNSIIDDLGWGSQLFCPLKYWMAERTDCMQPSLLDWGGQNNA